MVTLHIHKHLISRPWTSYIASLKYSFWLGWAHFPGQLTSFSLTGVVVALLPSMCMPFPLFNGKTLGKDSSTLGLALQVSVKLKPSSRLSACLSAGIDSIPLVAETWAILQSMQSLQSAPLVKQYIRQRAASSDLSSVLSTSHHCPLAWHCQSVVAPPSNYPTFPWWSGLTYLSLSFIYVLLCVGLNFIEVIPQKQKNETLMSAVWTSQMYIEPLY